MATATTTRAPANTNTVLSGAAGNTSPGDSGKQLELFKVYNAKLAAEKAFLEMKKIREENENYLAALKRAAAADKATAKAVV